MPQCQQRFCPDQGNPTDSADYQSACDYLASKKLQLDFLSVECGAPANSCQFHLQHNDTHGWSLEAILDLAQWTLSASAQSTSPFQAIDLVVERLQRQLLQHTNSYQRLLNCQTAINSATVRRDHGPQPTVIPSELSARWTAALPAR